MPHITRFFTLLFLAAGLALGATDASAQDSPDERIGAAIERARSAGVPVDLLQSKIAEGRAKGVPVDRIASAVERRGSALSRALNVIGGAERQVSPGDLSVGADALIAGVSGEALQSVARESSDQERSVAIAVLTQLVRIGQTPEHALEQVRAAMRRGPDALANLPAEAAAALGRSLPPAAGARPPDAGPPPGAGPPEDVPPAGNPPGGGKPDNLPGV